MAELPPLNALRTFLFAAETQSFKRAAERLFVTQAAVSHQIRLLEDILGTQLFQRLNREVRLTTEGEQLLPYVRSAFKSLRSGVEQIKADAEPNRLTLSVIPSFASRWLVYHLKDFQQLYPEIHIILQPGLGLETFENSSVDLAIRFGTGSYEGLKSEILMRDSMIAVATPNLLDAKPIDIEQLKALPLLEDFSPGSVGWNNWLVDQNQNPDNFRIALTIQDSSMVIDATLNGQGVGLVRKSLAQKIIDEQQLVQVLDTEIPTPFSYYLVAPESHFQKGKNQLFAEWLKKELERSFLPEYIAYYGS